MDTIKQSNGWPKPTTPEPTIGTLLEWAHAGVVDATDGCRVEPDGECEHGYPSWLIELGVV